MVFPAQRSADGRVLSLVYGVGPGARPLRVPARGPGRRGPSSASSHRQETVEGALRPSPSAREPLVGAPIRRTVGLDVAFAADVLEAHLPEAGRRARFAMELLGVGFFTFHRPATARSGSRLSRLQSTSDTPRSCARSRPRIAAVYSATLLVAMPIPSAVVGTRRRRR